VRDDATPLSHTDRADRSAPSAGFARAIPPGGTFGRGATPPSEGQYDATGLVPPGWRAALDDAGNILLTSGGNP